MKKAYGYAGAAAVATAVTVALLYFNPGATGYMPRYIVGAGEYTCLILDTKSGKVYNPCTGVPTLYAGLPAGISDVIGGAHTWYVLDSTNVWAWGLNSNGECGQGNLNENIGAPAKIVKDSTGKTFTNVIQLTAGGTRGGWSVGALKGDGTVWVWGNTQYGLRGNGQQGQNNPLPVQVNFPAGTVITKIQIYMIGIALDSAGFVWTWGDAGEYTSSYNVGQGIANPDYTRPHKIPLPGPAKDIAGGQYWNYALLRSGSLYGWAYYTAYLGIGNNGFTGFPGNANSNGIMVPQLLDTALKFPCPVAQIAVNNNASYVILADSSLWAWGDNSQGCIGNGVEINYATYHAPYAWDWGYGELLQQKPIHIAPAIHSFTNIFTTSAYDFYAYAEDVNGQLYSWGRNKYGVLGNGILECDSLQLNISATYPNSWDVPLLTAVNPLAITKATIVTSPYCTATMTTAPCNLCTMLPPTKKHIVRVTTTAVYSDSSIQSQTMQ